jgi:hypothetical protein
LLVLRPPRLELALLLFPFRVEQFDTDVLGQLVLGDGLTTIRTFGGCNGASTLDT